MNPGKMRRTSMEPCIPFPIQSSSPEMLVVYPSNPVTARLHEAKQNNIHITQANMVHTQDGDTPCQRVAHGGEGQQGSTCALAMNTLP